MTQNRAVLGGADGADGAEGVLIEFFRLVPCLPYFRRSFAIVDSCMLLVPS